MSGKALVIGGRGFLGNHVATALLRDGWDVKILDRNRTRTIIESSVQTVVGNVFDKDALRTACTDVDAVFYFVSHSLPSASPNDLHFELQHSLLALDNVLCTMVELNVKKIVFPSSGGTIYGNVEDRTASEATEPRPLSAYGQGKLLSEEIIQYYGRSHPIQYLILRISNVYGCHSYRKVEQGAVDIFIQNIFHNQPVTIWSRAERSIRDYIFIDDFCDALMALLHRNKCGIYNIGTGVGTSLMDIIELIERITNRRAVINNIDKYSGGVARNVLDISKMKEECLWYPKYSLEEGIKQTIQRKRDYDHEIS